MRRGSQAMAGSIVAQALWAALLLASLHGAAAADNTSPVRGARRALLADSWCTASSQSLLTNGYFDTWNLSNMNNHLVTATMAADAYPWAKQFGIPIMDVVQGMTQEQVATYQRLFAQKYSKLGATNFRFFSSYSQSGDVAAHAVVVGTSKNVFLIYRGTADLGQGWTSADISAVPYTVMGQTLYFYQAPFRSVMLIWSDVLSAVRAAVAKTDNPSAARVFTTGHSLGGASACLAGLLLHEAGLNVGGVYAYAPYKLGTTCNWDQNCWVTVYDRNLADRTWVWWNNQDPVPALLDNALGTTFSNSKWGHVPRDRGWIRVVGDQCMKASGTRLTDICPPEVEAADGAADGVCSKTVVEAHYPWVYQQKVARCTLLQGSRDGSSARMDSCNRASVWENLLGLPVPPPGAAAAVSSLGELATRPSQDDAEVLDGLQPMGGRRLFG